MNPMGTRLRAAAIATFSGLRAVAWIGLAASLVLLIASVLLGIYWGFEGPQAWCSDCAGPEREVWLLATGIGMGVALLGTLLFALVLVAAGGPARRGRRWADRHTGSLVQARGWFADGRISKGQYDSLAERFMRHERGQIEGEPLRAFGGLLSVLGWFLLPAAAVMASVAMGDPQAGWKATVAGGASVCLILGVVCESAGPALYFTGRRIARLSRQSLHSDLDALAREARQQAAAPSKRKPRGARPTLEASQP